MRESSLSSGWNVAAMILPCRTKTGSPPWVNKLPCRYCSAVPQLHSRRLTRRWVGLTPKRLLRIARFQTLLGGLAPAEPVRWAATASEAGYTDQAHLVREVGELAGCSPGKLLRGGLADSFTLRCEQPGILPRRR